MKRRSLIIILLIAIASIPIPVVHAVNPAFSELYPGNTTVNTSVWTIGSSSTNAISPVCNGCGTYTFVASAHSTIIVGWGCGPTGASIKSITDQKGLTWLLAGSGIDTVGTVNSIDSWVYYAQTGTTTGQDRITVNITASGFNCFGLIDYVSAEEDALGSNFVNKTTTGLANVWTLSSQNWGGGDIGIYAFAFGSAASKNTAPWFNNPAHGVAPLSTLCAAFGSSNGCAALFWGTESAAEWGSGGSVSMTGSTNGLGSTNQQASMLTIQFGVKIVTLVIPCTWFQQQCWWYPSLFFGLYLGLFAVVARKAEIEGHALTYMMLSGLNMAAIAQTAMGLLTPVLPILLITLTVVYVVRFRNR